MKRSTRKSLKYRVGRGIRFLNREYGRSWLRKVDPERLALEDGKACILGQVEGDYNDALEKLNIEPGYEYGFDITFDECDSDLAGAYEKLTGEWRKQIARLRKLFDME